MGQEFTKEDFEHLSREEAVDALRFLVTQFQQTRNLGGVGPRYAGKPQNVETDPMLDQDASNPVTLQSDAQQEICRYRDRMGIAEALTATVRVFPPEDGSFQSPGLFDPRFPTGQVGNITDANNPFNVQAASGGLVLPGNIKQAFEIVGILQSGHAGMDLKIPFNMPLGQLLRLPITASAASISAQFSPRYTPKLGAGAVFSWLVPPTGSNFDRNAAFDSIVRGSQFIAEQPVPVQLQGFVCKGYSNPLPVLRLFFGWIDAGAPQNTQHLCPVPRGAQNVLLFSDVTAQNNDPGAGAAFQGVRLMLNQINQSPGAATTRRGSLNNPAMTTLPLLPDCSAIEVVNLDGGAKVPVAVPFCLVFDLGL